MIQYLPTINALFNLTSAILLLLGRINIKRGRREVHRKIMISAMISSALFLTGYLVYHGQVGSIPYKHFDWTRPLYFGILIPHSILAAVMTPFIIAAFIYALKGKFDKHYRLVRWVWPVWMFVSITGIIVYLMLYHL
jgi:putative membrane protein